MGKRILTAVAVAGLVAVLAGCEKSNLYTVPPPSHAATSKAAPTPGSTPTPTPTPSAVGPTPPAPVTVTRTTTRTTTTTVTERAHDR